MEAQGAGSAAQGRGKAIVSRQREAVVSFVLGMLIPCSVVVYLLIKENFTPDLTLHYTSLRVAHPEATAVLKVLTNWGNAVFYPLYAGLLLWGIKRHKPELTRFACVYLVVQLLVSFALVRFLKIYLGCPRPDVAGLCLPMSFDAGHNSLPSGHTVEVVGAAMPLVMRAGSWFVTLGLGGFVGLMAYSRVYLGWHHPVDVAFGLAFGSFAAWLIHSYGQ